MMPLRMFWQLAKKGCRAVCAAILMASAFLAPEAPYYDKPQSEGLPCLLQQAVLAAPAFAAGQLKEHDTAQDTAAGAGQAEPGTTDDPGTMDEPGKHADSPNMKEQKRKTDLEDSMDELLPLSPDEIRSFMDRQDEADSAVSPDPASMKTRVVSLPCTPQKSPHVVHLAAGYSSTIMLQDVTGAPWPVLTAILGNAEAFSLSSPGRADAGDKADKQDVRHSHMVTVLPLKGHASSNLVLTLQDAAYPVLLHLVSLGARGKGRVSDALTIIRLEGRGPSARPAVLEPRLETASDELLSLVHGIVPENAKKIRAVPQVPGLSMWRCKDRLLLRSPYEAIWPAWFSRAGNDGMKAYAMPLTPSIVISVGGRAQSVRLGDAASGMAP